MIAIGLGLVGFVPLLRRSAEYVQIDDNTSIAIASMEDELADPKRGLWPDGCNHVDR